jgi:hypothetical protein
MSLTINGLPVASMRFVAAWTGVWFAELTITGDVLPPAGPAVIVSTDGIALTGTIDEDFTASFGPKRYARVIGGGGGWRKTVRPQHYHSDVGVSMQVVASTTGAEVGEAATVIIPSVLGTDFVRRAGPASEIFAAAGVDWWVGLDGITKIGIRPPLPQPPSLQILDWDPEAGTMSFTATALVEPGTVVIDPRFGQRVVRSVEATLESASVNGTLWVSSSAPDAGAASELVDSLAELAERATRAKFGRLYEYRVIDMQGDRVEVQAVHPLDGVPDILPVSVWAGASGYRAKLTPASSVLVGFIAGDPTRPYVAAYEPPEADGWRPLELDLDATAAMSIGALAVAVTLGAAEGALPIARAPAIVAFANALGVALAAAGTTAGATGATPVTGATLGGWLGTLATAVNTASSALGTACPSGKVVSS